MNERQTLARNDWQEIIDLSRKKTFQRKFQLVESFIKLVAIKGLHEVTHQDIALKCKVTRQLVDHHFPENELLILLAYRYVYARFQKFASDAVMLQKGPLNQLGAYINAVSTWVYDYREDARFLAQFFALAPMSDKLSAAHERNLRIGQERIHVLLSALKKEGYFKKLKSEDLGNHAFSIQLQIAGYVVLVSMPSISTLKFKHLQKELLRSCLGILGLHPISKISS
jgi:AcrR family transcriptional regulator